MNWKLDASLILFQSFPGSSAGKELPAMQETPVQFLGNSWGREFLGSGRFTEEEKSYPLQYPCLKNSMDRGAWQATVHGVAKSLTWLKSFHFTSILFQALCCLSDMLHNLWFSLMNIFMFHVISIPLCSATHI